jgi:uncharacterized protein (TIGR00369 family)
MGRTRWDAIQAGDVVIPVNAEFGFEIVSGSEDEVVYRWKVPEEYCNSAGNLQGGVMAAFADTLLGMACAPHMTEDDYPALAEMKISILRPAAAGSTITGRGVVLKRGRRVLFVEAEVTGEHGQLLAKASGTEIPTPL